MKKVFIFVCDTNEEISDGIKSVKELVDDLKQIEDNNIFRTNKFDADIAFTNDNVNCCTYGGGIQDKRFFHIYRGYRNDTITKLINNEYI